MIRTLRKLLPSAFDARSNWRSRFADRSEGWAAVADKRLSDEQYLQAAAEKYARLQRVLQSWGPGPAGRSLLDAGCGYGNFTEAFRLDGFVPLGVDYIDQAVEQARVRHPQCAFELADVGRMRLQRRFDVIVTIDTLINVVEDREWRRILAALVRHLEPQGSLVILEHLRDAGESDTPARHVTFRTQACYADTLAGLGLEIVHHERFPVRVQDIHEDILVVRRDSA